MSTRAPFAPTKEAHGGRKRAEYTRERIDAGGGKTTSDLLPTAGEKAALVGTSGSPSGANKFVTNADPRNSDARTPLAHKTSHENGGSDEISVVGLSGLLADPQTPTTHKNTHKSGGGDAFAVTDLLEALIKRIRESGGADLLVGAVADGEFLKRSGTSIIGGATTGGAPTDAEYVVTAAHAGLSAEKLLGTEIIMKGTLAARPAAGIAGRLYYVTDAGDERLTRDTGVAWEDLDVDWDHVTSKPATFTPAAHAASHANGGADEISVAGLSGQLADSQIPLHQRVMRLVSLGI